MFVSTESQTVGPKMFCNVHGLELLLQRVRIEYLVQFRKTQKNLDVFSKEPLTNCTDKQPQPIINVINGMLRRCFYRNDFTSS